jgi:hypothetical protein
VDGLVIWWICWWDEEAGVVVTMGSVVVVMAFCRTGDGLGGNGSWSGVNPPSFGGKGGGFDW